MKNPSIKLAALIILFSVLLVSQANSGLSSSYTLTTKGQILHVINQIPKYGICSHWQSGEYPGCASVYYDLATAGSYWIRGDTMSTSGLVAFWNDMKAHNIKVLGLLSWYHTTTSGFQSLVQSLVSAVPDLPAWEIGNEPEQSWWGGPMSTQTYLSLLQIAYPIIKAANPDAIIVGPAVATSGASFLNELKGIGGFNYLDVISTHYYIKYGQTDLQAIKNVVAGAKPIWITETGWTTADQSGGEAAQANYVQNYYSPTGIFGSDPAVQVILNYELNDNSYPAPAGVDDGWGLTYGRNDNYATKQAYAVFKNLLAGGT
jgi:hypothetical protein